MTSRCGSISWMPVVARWVCAPLDAWRKWPIINVFNRSQMAGRPGKETAMKTAVVTGGGSGIGRAVADRLRADGYHVATIDLNPSDDEFAQTADVTDRAQVEAALSAIRAQLGPGDDPGQRGGPGRVQAVHRHHLRRMAESGRRESERRVPLHSGGAARHGRRRLGTHRQHLLVEHPFRHARICRTMWQPSRRSTD